MENGYLYMGEFKFQLPNPKSQIPKTEKRINENVIFQSGIALNSRNSRSATIE
jgi:hypothetical protein